MTRGPASKTGARNVAAAARRAKALDMRAAGVTYEDIAQELGYASKGAAYTDVRRALDATVREPAENLRLVELRHLDMLRQMAMAVLARTHVTVSGGKVVYDDDGVPLRDDGPTLAAIRELRRLSESRRRLLGLDAPAQVQVITDDAINAEIERLSAELAASGEPGAAG